MDTNIKLALVYIRNGQEMLFPVKDIDQAVRLADSIADSDLLNDFVDYNMFDVCEYDNGEIGDGWENEDGVNFEEYWDELRSGRFRI